MLKLRSVTKRFAGRAVLNAVCLDVAAGEYVAIVGDSGIGKSTLLNVIAGLEPADSGKILFGENEISGMDDDALAILRRDFFGFVFQAFHVLPHLTVQENVGLPLLLRGVEKKEIARKAANGIKAVGLGGREASLPRELSGGELQRVAIARALVGEPALVLADEPTGNLDAENASQVLGLIRRLVKEAGSAAILATHSEQVAEGCDRVYRLTASGLTPRG